MTELSANPTEHPGRLEVYRLALAESRTAFDDLMAQPERAIEGGQSRLDTANAPLIELRLFVDYRQGNPGRRPTLEWPLGLFDEVPNDVVAGRAEMTHRFAEQQGDAGWDRPDRVNLRGVVTAAPVLHQLQGPIE